MNLHGTDMTTGQASVVAGSVCALLTCFNRRAQTLACLAALQAAGLPRPWQLHAVLVDDGSRDGTADAVRHRYPWVEVIDGSGELYWCRGMHLAYARALAQGHDHYLWLNDDTLLDADALARLLACHAALQRQRDYPLIIVGSTRDEAGGRITYGGRRRISAWRSLAFALVTPLDEPQRLDTFDGNIVLVSADAARALGNLDPAFEHAMGDTDYGLRAGRLGVECWLAPGTHGRCDDNPAAGTHADPTLPWRTRWRLMLGRRGLPLRSWWRFTRRHAGPLWPGYFLWPYLRLAAAGLRLRRARTGLPPAGRRVGR